VILERRGGGRGSARFDGYDCERNPRSEGVVYIGREMDRVSC